MHFLQGDLGSNEGCQIAPRKGGYLRSSKTALARIDEIKAITEELGNSDCRNLLRSDARLYSAAVHLLQENLKKKQIEKRFQKMCYRQWKHMMEKHPNMQEFLDDYQREQLGKPKKKSGARLASRPKALHHRKRGMRKSAKSKRSDEMGMDEEVRGKSEHGSLEQGNKNEMEGGELLGVDAGKTSAVGESINVSLKRRRSDVEEDEEMEEASEHEVLEQAFAKKARLE